MALTDYAGLKAGIAEWLMREDLESAIPSFIGLAEAAMNRQLRLRHMLRKVDLVIGDDGTSLLPSDFLEIRRMELDGEEVPYLPPGQAGAYSAAWRGGRVRWYSVVGEALEFTQSTGGSNTGTLLYYARVPSLSDENPTNRVLSEAPDLYLYLSRGASAPFLGDDARLQTWAALAQEAGNALQLKDKEAQYPGPLVIRPSDAW
jgi:hypothetical protein